MPKKNKEALKKMIEDNGGVYSPNLEMKVTSILIISSPDGEKFKHACNWQIPCLTADWVVNSVQMGHALEMDGYTLEHSNRSRGASSPINERSEQIIPEISMCSTIANLSAIGGTVNETVDGDITCLSRKSASLLPVKEKLSIAAVDSLDLQQAMKNGLFLDGCKVYLMGFEGIHLEKLRRVLNAGGATRFNHLSECISHIVIGRAVAEELSMVRSWPSRPHLVTAEWVAKSMHEKKVADEEQFLYESPDESTFIAPKEMPKMNTTVVSGNNDTTCVEDDAIMKQYLQGGKKVVNETSFNDTTLPNSQATEMKRGVFLGKVFTVSGFDEEFTEQLIDVICENGGEVAPCDFKEKVHYSVITLDGAGTLYEAAEEYISPLFIEDCLENNKLLTVEYYHMPLILEDVKPLQNCIIATSSYKGKERTFLIELITILGAVFQEMFAKKDNPARGIKRCTHLLCPLPEGDKYQASVKWKVPAVTRYWLLESARRNAQLEVHPYLVGDSPNPDSEEDAKKIITQFIKSKTNSLASVVPTGHVDESIIIAPTPVNKKVKALQSVHDVKSVVTPDMETVRKMYPTPSANSNLSLSEMPTPETPYGCTWQSNPSSKTRKAFKRLLDSMPDEDRSKRVAIDEEQEDKWHERFLSNIRDAIMKDGSQPPVPSGDDCLKVAEVNDKVKPLSGVVVYVCKKHVNQQQDIFKIVLALGGEYRWTYDNSVTHIIFQGKNNDITKEFRVAREQGKTVVSPEWIYMCKQENICVDESLFPHTYNPKMSLSVMSTKSPPVHSDKACKIVCSQLSSINDGMDDREGFNENNSISEINNKETLTKQLEEIEALATSGASARKNSLNRNKSVVDRPIPTPPKDLHPQSGSHETYESQGTAITWEDPSDKAAREKLKDQMICDTQEINDQMNCSGAEMGASEESLPCEMQRQEIVVAFSSGITEEEKVAYTDIITSLGGTVSTSPNFDPSWTHVITQKPSRSEKHLAAIASGKWILAKSFLDESWKAGKFVSEETHEWGNPLTQDSLFLDPDKMEYKLSTAAYRWRKIISENNLDPSHNGPKGAFANMRAVIQTSRERQVSFSRLIVAGGGTVVCSSQPDFDLNSVTHCFVELHKSGKFDLAIYAARGIPCLPPVFLNDLLVCDPSPCVDDHCIPEYKEVIANMSSAIDNFSIRRKKKV